MGKLPFTIIFWRSFFIQAFWNYPRMLGVGFLYALQPAARVLFPDRQSRIEFLKRHSSYFNAQPYCASLALGYVLRREKDLVRSGDTATEERQNVLKIKEDLCGMLGLIGDQIFWQLLKPTASSIGMTAALVIALIAGQFGLWPALIGVILFLLIFNPLHLWMRWWGLMTGFHAGEGLVASLASGVIPRLRRRLTSIGIYAAVMLTLVAFTFARRQLGHPGWVAFALCFAVMTAMLKIRVPVHLALLTVAALCLIPVLLGLD
jgi:mannose/fructose/N-acetylgalactosamine-specific phosphotransferase system component IID